MHLHAATYPPTPVPDRVTDVPADILSFAADAFDAGLGAALVTLIGIKGGAARALGSQMAIAGDGRYCGYVSGGCTEAVVATEALVAIENGSDRILLLGEGSPFFDIVLPCGGGITLAIHVLRESVEIGAVSACLYRRERISLSYDPDGQKLKAHAYALRSGWHGGHFVRAFRPVARVVISGYGIEADVVEALSKSAGYHSVRVEPGSTSAWRKTSIDSDTAVVLLHHDLDSELTSLKAAMAASPFYIGALGSRRTHQRRREKLLEIGFTELDLDRIKAPIGLFEKARDASALAISVLADVAAAYSAN